MERQRQAAALEAMTPAEREAHEEAHEEAQRQAMINTRMNGNREVVARIQQEEAAAATNNADPLPERPVRGRGGTRGRGSDPATSDGGGGLAKAAQRLQRRKR